MTQAIHSSFLDQSAEYLKSKKRSITRRGVMWLGQTCNIRCHFCYFLDRINSTEHPEHPFMSIEKAKKICSTLVDVYANNAIDIQGGEPTLYRHINELVEHCRTIGLIPTLITNAIALQDLGKCLALKEAGIRDLLVSVQGIGDTYDEIVGVKGAHRKQRQGLENIVKAGIPIRFNCVLSKPALPQLEQIAQLAVNVGARAVNFLAFNPFEDQQIPGKRSATNVPRYSEVSPCLNAAMDILAEASVECNVRYFPICMVEPRHRKSMFNFQQLPYDPHEWDYASWSWTGQQPQRMKWGDCSPATDLARETYAPIHYKGPFKPVADVVRQLVTKYPSLRGPAHKVHVSVSKLLHSKSDHSPELSEKENLYRDNARLRSSQHCRYQYDRACETCDVRRICDGFHGDYASLFGTDEARGVKLGRQIDNPKYFIAEQEKVIEKEDFEWAL
jgi:sulfatase maturation enzyme AslB (radical SAM superfamily)